MSDEQSFSRKELMRLITRKNIKRKNVEKYLENQLLDNGLTTIERN